MEFYIPETEFKESDFKGVPSKKNIPQKKAARSPVSRKDQKTQNLSKSKLPREVRYKITNPGDPIAKNTNEPKKAPSIKPAPQKNRPMSPRQARAVEIKNAHAPDSWKPQTISKSMVTKPALSKAVRKPTKPKINTLISDTVRSNLESSRHILRNWLWEKKGMSTSNIAYIAPHDRIYLALRLMGMDVLQILFKTMTRKEREQFVKILKDERSVSDGFAAAVQSEFILQVTNHGSF